MKRHGTLALLLAMALALPLFLGGCSGDDGRDGRSGVLFGIESLTPPSGPAGQYTIDTSGGSGSSGAGGEGGYIDLEIYDGSLGGNIKVFKTGKADASFTFPNTVTTYLGNVPLTVTTNTTIAVVTAEPTAGTAYLVAGDRNIYISDGDSSIQDEMPVTGISIASGATLTLQPNWSDSFSYDTAAIMLDNDIANAGTLTTTVVNPSLMMTDIAQDRSNLEIDCDVYYGASGSAIVLTGANNASSTGGHGGDLDMDLDDDNWSLYQSAGSFFNQGTIQTSGGQGVTGGDAGSIYIYSAQAAYNTGAMTALGGTGTGGAGGHGAYIEIDTDYGHNFNSAPLNASGGNGTTTGGDAGYVYLYIGYPGHLLNSGDLSSNGGDGPAGGGSGDYIEFGVYGGDIINSGNLSSTGGTATTGSGGHGGYIYAWSEEDNGWYSEMMPVANIEFSGNFNTSGGSGTVGGHGGYIEFLLDADENPNNQELILYGYTGFVTNGGNGSTTGGSAGYVYMENEEASDWFDDIEGPSGGLVNYANITAIGGIGAAGSGGHGGSFEMYTDDMYGYATLGEVSINFADLNLRGGNGTTMGGHGGEVYIWGFNHAENRGDIDASGGNASDAAGSAGDGAHSDGIYILSDLGAAINSGNIDASGGDATGTGANFGGHGYHIEIVGYSAKNSGDLSVAGGSAGATSGTGGDADVVFIYGIFDGATNTASAIDISGGSANTAGSNGEVFLDGMNVTNNWL